MRLAARAAGLTWGGLALALGMNAFGADRAGRVSDKTPSAQRLPAEGTDSTYKLQVNVNFVLVETTVRDARGAIVDGLNREDFSIVEDGVVQEIRHFSRDELPLAVAIVIDRSGSIRPIVERLRDAALETLSLLKPEDEVALFAFDSTPECLEDLTTNRKRIAEGIAAISAGGGTNITDALFDAAGFLRHAAPTRRHAIVLVSDNQSTVRGQASPRDVIRSGLQSETVIYSIRVGSNRTSRYLLAPVTVPGTKTVNDMTEETGGEVFEAYDGRSIKTAMGAVISRLKKRYTLGYISTNTQADGAFRKVAVSLNEHSPAADRDYRIFARTGYYAPLPPSATAKERRWRPL